MKPDPKDVLPEGTRFGRYQIVRCIGSGGMGAVYEARHLDLEKRVAMKILHRALATDVQMVERFLREGRAASRIHHPHVVDVSDVGSHEGTPFLVMEFLEGEDLGGMLSRLGEIPLDKLAGLMLPVIAAIATAHDVGIVHRDLKPENIFLSRARNGGVVPKVLDFGISKLGGPEHVKLTNSTAVLGTPCYMSPEQAQRSTSSDARSDVYSLGVILYECATGKLPIRGESLYEVLLAIATGDFDPPRKVKPELPAPFDTLVMRAMAHEPPDRFQTAHALGRALLPFASAAEQSRWEPVFVGGQPSTLPPTRADEDRSTQPTVRAVPPAIRQPTEVVPRRRGVVAAAVVALGVLSAAVFWFASAHRSSQSPRAPLAATTTRTHIATTPPPTRATLETSTPRTEPAPDAHVAVVRPPDAGAVPTGARSTSPVHASATHDTAAPRRPNHGSAATSHASGPGYQVE